MCGIAGFLATSVGADYMTAAVQRMNATQRHRGPDDSGYWSDADAGVALGHRRLSILDLSPLGHQPMHSASGRYVITYNGEIYNFQAVRSELQAHGHRFHSSSDTEVMLAAFEQWGVDASLERFNGMFAFAVWDRTERRLHLARDRFGEKPLYYGWCNRTFLFGSELKALRSHFDFDSEIDREALAEYLRSSCIAAPRTIYSRIRKLPPASSVVIDPKSRGQMPSARVYWSAKDVLIQAQANPFTGSAAEACDGVERLAREAVRMRMVSDVPLGAFLSGGVDSSTIVALMQAQSAQPVNTFSIGFDEQCYNEAAFAAQVAHHLGTNHTELYVSASDLLTVVPRVPSIYDEPFADSSQIPTFLLCEMTRRKVTVALSGDGGDEIFGGYPQYFFWAAVWDNVSRVPWAIRRPLAELLRSVEPGTWTSLLKPFLPVLPRRLREVRRSGENIRALAHVMGARCAEEWCDAIAAHWKSSEQLLRDYHPPKTANALLGSQAVEPRRRLMLRDLSNYLPDDLMVKTDRASMAVSLEVRNPFLDPDLIAFVSRLPMRMLVSRWEGKLLLRELLFRYVPKALVDRPKRGFSVPMGSWVRGPLRNWTEDLLAHDSLERQGYLDAGAVRKLWASHLCGHRDYSNQLWNVLVFQGWLESCRGQERMAVYG